MGDSNKDKSKSIQKKYGSRAEVFHCMASMTTGGLEKKDLIKNKHGYIVSLKKSKMSKNPDHNPLLKMGLLAKRGSKEFGPRKDRINEGNGIRTNKKSNKVKKGKSGNNKKSKKGFLGFLFS